MGGVIVRDNLPSNTSAAMEILKTSYFAPSDRETFPANLKILQEILDYQDEHGVKPRKFPCGRMLTMGKRTVSRWLPVMFCFLTRAVFRSRTKALL